ncbi:hypothetical protein BFP72_13860 [Reichenbachiella sp. 5M10]|uniref:response regulator transcription factor n=1 Tax=Reichenbachiella sp. 5M10 TaxID=1889772 RepID=UPI000C14F4B3|nr:response regulator transcription factor [Reichenbachiella sp. 5M10]PIB36404.1 hypothetical protein BFP72_13860 [Reichenbachiella sp. 5M10]
MKPIQVAFIDDHKIMLQGLSSLLCGESSIHIIGAFQSAEEYLSSDLAKQTDVLLLDINLKQLSGIALAEQLSGHFPNMGIIMLTALKEMETIVQSIKAGARGFLTKEVEKKEIIEAICRVSRGEYYFDQIVSNTVFESFATGIMTGKDQHSILTKREEEVLMEIAKGRQHKQIADTLCVSPKTIESHKANLQKKLNLHSTAELVKYAIKQGLVEI